MPRARLLHSLLWKHAVCWCPTQLPQSSGLQADKEGKPVGSRQIPRACGSPVVTRGDQRQLGATGIQLKAFLTVWVSPGRAGIILWMGLKLRGAAHGAGGSESITGISKALGSFWCTLCAPPVSPSHTDLK